MSMPQEVVPFMGRNKSLCVGAALLGLLLFVGNANAKGGAPEDLLKGKLIISDASLPTKWTSPGEFAARLKKLHKGSLNYDKKTGKVQIYYAAFFEKPVNDLEVKFVVYDITNGVGSKTKKMSAEAFMNAKGQRVLFNAVELDKEDLEMNKKYLFTVEYKNQILAKSEMILRGEAPKYSGKVEFTEEETKKKE